MDKLLLLITLLLSMANGSELVDYKPFRVDTTHFSIPTYPMIANVDSLQKRQSKLDQEFRYFYKPTGKYPEKIWKKTWFLNNSPERVFQFKYSEGIAYTTSRDTCWSDFCNGQVEVYEDAFENLAETDLRHLGRLAEFNSLRMMFPKFSRKTTFLMNNSDTSILNYEWEYDKNYNLKSEKKCIASNGKVIEKISMVGRPSIEKNYEIMRYIGLTLNNEKHYDSEIWVDCFDKNKVLQKKVRIRGTLSTPKYLIKSYTYTPDGKVDRIYHYNSKKNAYTKVELNTWDEQGQLRETHFYKLDKVKDGIYDALENKIIKKEYDSQGRLVHEVELVRKK